MEESFDNPEPFTDHRFPLIDLVSLDPYFQSFDKSKISVVRLKEVVPYEIPRLLQHETESRSFIRKDFSSNFFICFLSCLDSDQEIIFDFLKTECVSADGKYTGHYFEMGEEKELDFDDLFLAREEKASIRLRKFLTRFESESQSYLWPFLIEKFFIKLYGSFSNFMKAKPHEMLYAVLGGYYSIIEVDKEKGNQLWSQLKKNELFFNEKLVKKVGVGSSRKISMQMSSDEFQRILVAYRKKNNRIEPAFFKILGFEEVSTGEKQHRLICMKNNEFSLSVKEHLGSVTLPESVQRALGFVQFERGFFWLDFNQFLKEFQYISVNYYRRRKTVLNKTVASKMSLISFPKELWLDFELKELEKKSVIGVHQKHKPTIGPIEVNGAKYSYSLISISVFQVFSENGRRQLGLVDKNQILSKNAADSFIRFNLMEPGQYLIHVQIDWAHEISPNLSFSFLSWKESFVPITQQFSLNTLAAFSSLFASAFLSRNPDSDYVFSESLGSDKFKFLEPKTQVTLPSSDLARSGKLKMLLDSLNYTEISHQFLPPKPNKPEEKPPIKVGLIEAGVYSGLVIATKKSMKGLFAIKFNPAILSKMAFSEKSEMASSLLKNEQNSAIFGERNFFCLILNHFPSDLSTDLAKLGVIDLLVPVSQEESSRHFVIRDFIQNSSTVSLVPRPNHDLFFPHATVMQHALSIANNSRNEATSSLSLMRNTLNFRPENESFMSLVIHDPNKKTTLTMRMHLEETKKERRYWNGKETKCNVTFLRYPQYLAVLIENLEKFLSYFEESSFSLENLLLQDEEMVNGSLSFVVKPGGKKLLIARVVEAGKSYSYKFQTRYKFAF